MSPLSGISSSVSPILGNSGNAFGQSLNALQSALQSGNLSTAQTAFSSLLNFFPTASQSSTSGTTSASASTNALSGDLQSLQSAIQSGNVNAAQTVLTKLTADLRNFRGHGHHHRSYGGGGISSEQTNSGTSSPGATSGLSSTGSTSSDLLDAIQSSSETSGHMVNYLA